MVMFITFITFAAPGDLLQVQVWRSSRYDALEKCCAFVESVIKKMVVYKPLPETKKASLHLKIDRWKMKCPFGMAHFQGLYYYVSFRECSLQHLAICHWSNCEYKKPKNLIGTKVSCV